ncbi:MAG: hypothetical protein ACK4GL_05695 [Flavobacteriales bacterium]
MIGPVLQDYYTIRYATGDTLRFNHAYDPANFNGIIIQFLITANFISSTAEKKI